MTLLNPLALGLSAFAIPIVLMYMLKLRRQEKTISSTFLWRRAVDDLQANAPWQRLRASLLLLVQLLVLAALVLTLAQPAYSHARTYAGDLVLIVDQSYGMQAHDVSPSRFAEAQRQARALASERSSGSVVSVIGMGAQPTMRVAESGDLGKVQDAIDNLKVQVSPPNVLGALTLAASLARSGTPIHAVLLTSRTSGISRPPLSLPFPLQIVRIGSRLRDLGISAFSVVQLSGATHALVRVSNFGSATASSTIQLTVDGRLADVRPITLVAGRSVNLFWSALPAGTRVLKAHLTARDDVDLDKSAWAAVSSLSTRRVLIVSDRKLFLQAALSVDPTVQAEQVAPSQFVPSLARGYDLLVFDAALPKSLPTTPALFVAPPAGRVGPMRFGGLVGAGIPGPSSGAGSSLLQYVNLSDVHVARARQVFLPSWLAPVITAGGSTLLAAGEHSGVRDAVLSFDFQDSDWPLRIGFPVLIHNLLQYLSPGLAVSTANVTAGSSVHLQASSRLSRIEIERPDGTLDTLAQPFPPYTSTDQPGLYQIRFGGNGHQQILSFAVNFFPSRPAPSTGPATTWSGSSRASRPRAVSIPVSVAWAGALAVLALLSAEWWLSYKR